MVLNSIEELLGLKLLKTFILILTARFQDSSVCHVLGFGRGPQSDGRSRAEGTQWVWAVTLTSKFPLI